MSANSETPIEPECTEVDSSESDSEFCETEREKKIMKLYRDFVRKTGYVDKPNYKPLKRKDIIAIKNNKKLEGTSLRKGGKNLDAVSIQGIRDDIKRLRSKRDEIRLAKGILRFTKEDEPLEEIFDDPIPVPIPKQCPKRVKTIEDIVFPEHLVKPKPVRMPYMPPTLYRDTPARKSPLFDPYQGASAFHRITKTAKRNQNQKQQQPPGIWIYRTRIQPKPVIFPKGEIPCEKWDTRRVIFGSVYSFKQEVYFRKMEASYSLVILAKPWDVFPLRSMGSATISLCLDVKVLSIMRFCLSQSLEPRDNTVMLKNWNEKTWDSIKPASCTEVAIEFSDTMTAKHFVRMLSWLKSLECSGSAAIIV